MSFHYRLFVTVDRIPDGYDLVCDYAVMHPNRREGGALLRNKNTGIYMMLIVNALVSVPQEWARNNPKPFSFLDV